jgi:hypothetical protein
MLAAAAAAFHSFSKTITATLLYTDTPQYKRTLPQASVFASQQHLLYKQ